MLRTASAEIRCKTFFGNLVPKLQSFCNSVSTIEFIFIYYLSSLHPSCYDLHPNVHYFSCIIELLILVSLLVPPVNICHHRSSLQNLAQILEWVQNKYQCSGLPDVYKDNSDSKVSRLCSSPCQDLNNQSSRTRIPRASGYLSLSCPVFFTNWATGPLEQPEMWGSIVCFRHLICDGFRNYFNCCTSPSPLCSIA